MSYTSDLQRDNFSRFCYLVDIHLDGGTLFHLVEGSIYPLSLTDGENTLIYTPALINKIAITQSLSGEPVSIDLVIDLQKVTSFVPGVFTWLGTVRISRLPIDETNYRLRHPVFSGDIDRYTYGYVDEPVTLTVVTRSIDVGKSLPEDSQINPDTWPDSGRSVQDSRLTVSTEYAATSSSEQTTTADDLGQYRAYQSNTLWPGELIGYPFYGRCVIVEDVNIPSTSNEVDLLPYLHIITTGTLKVKENRIFYFYGVNREKFNAFCYGNDGDDDTYIYDQQVNGEIYSFTRLTTSTGDPRYIDMDPGDDTILKPTSYLSIPNPCGSAPGDYVLNVEESICGVGLTLQPCDHLAFQQDGDGLGLLPMDFRMLINIQGPDSSVTGSVLNICTFRSAIPHATDDWEMPGENQIRVVPAHSTSTSCWIRADVYGGIVGLDGQVLRKVSDVMNHLHRRSAGIDIDYAALQRLNTFDLYIDGQILDGDISPTDFIREQICSIFPLKPTIGGDGLRYEIVDWESTDISCTLDLGLDKPSGYRVSQVQSTPVTDVYNDIRFHYGWHDMTGNYLKHCMTTTRHRNDLESGRAAMYVTSDLIETSQKLYGRRVLDIYSKFVNDENTAAYIVRSALSARHKPRPTLIYRLSPAFNWLTVNQVCMITDESISIQNKRYLIIQITYTTDDGPLVTLQEM